MFILIVNASILQSKSIPFDNDNYPFQIYMVASPETVYQKEHFNMSLAITNIHFEDLLNVSLQFKVHNDLEVINSSVPDLDMENDTSKGRYTIGSLDVDEIYLFTVEYNVTTGDTKTISVEGMNVSYQLQNGLSSYVISNTVNILLKGEQAVSETKTLTIPSNFTPPDDNLIYFAYLFPIIMFGISIFILRRLRR